MTGNLSLVSQPDLPDLAKRREWLAKAESLKPQLHHNLRKPIGEVSVVADEEAWQGWRVEPAGGPEELENRPLGGGEVITLDFGQHMVGRLSFDLVIAKGFEEEVKDSPFRVRIIFAETPVELGEDSNKYHDQQTLSWNWFQDEYVTTDEFPKKVKLPRRYAFRYIRFEVQDIPTAKKMVCIKDIEVKSVCAVSSILPSPHKNLPHDLVEIDAVGVRTLRDCMQTVFEDGPKRDRRLWLGDLRLQMLVNQVSYRETDLVKRCLLLFAALSDENGLIPACLYEEPKPKSGANFILDYSLLFPAVLLDYYKSGGDENLIREFWPLLVAQTNYGLELLDSKNIFQDPGNMWLFVDWKEDLHKQAALHCILLYALRCNQRLAQIQGLPEAGWMRLAEHICVAGRDEFWDDNNMAVCSGPDRQRSYASWAWAVISRLLKPKEGQMAYKNLINDPEAVRPAGPYLMHYVVEAMIVCGMENAALELVRDYWGGMVKRGADTFWEVYDPDQPLLSPYNNPQINSYCHAWSCTASWYIRSGLLGDLW